MRSYQSSPEYSQSIEGQLSDGEDLVAWCECFTVNWGIRTTGWTQTEYYEVDHMGWYWLSQTNINLRLGTWRPQYSGGIFTGQEVAIPEVAGVQTFAIRDIVSYEFVTVQPNESLQWHLNETLEDWPKTSPAGDVIDINLSLNNGNMISLCSPFEQIMEIAKNLDAMKSKAADGIAERTTEKAAQFSVGDEIRKLADLRESGILSEEEFEQQKAKLLNAD